MKRRLRSSWPLLKKDGNAQQSLGVYPFVDFFLELTVMAVDNCCPKGSSSTALHYNVRPNWKRKKNESMKRRV